MAYGTAPTSGGTGDAITTDTIATIDGGGGTFGEAQIVKVAYGATGDANVVSATQPFPISLAASTFVFSTVNTSVVQLAAGASFTGTIEAIPNQPAVSVLLASDQPVILFVEQFIDAAGVFAAPIIYTNPTMIAANAGTSFSFPANGNYIRIRARNAGGATTTTFNINTAFGNLMPATAKGNLPMSINEIGGTVVTGTLPVTVSAPDIGLTTRSQAIDDAASGALPSSVTLKGEAGGPLEGVALLDELVQGNFQIPVTTPDIAKSGTNAGVQIADAAGPYIISSLANNTGTITIDTTGYQTVTVNGIGGAGSVQVYCSDTAAPGTWWNCTGVIYATATSVVTPANNISVPWSIAGGQPGFGQFPCLARYMQFRQVNIVTAPAIASIYLRSQPMFQPANISTNTGFTTSRIDGGQGADNAGAATSSVLIGGKARTALITALTATQQMSLVMTNSGATVVEKHAVPELTWNYAPPASGLVNTTTAVTIKAAVAGQRGNISAIQIQHEPLGAATEFAIRDGAAGTVLWRIKMPVTTAEGPTSYTFDPPIRQAAVNTLLEIVTLTASVTGAVYFNAQGFMSN
jgi:hypothetical protein